MLDAISEKVLSPWERGEKTRAEMAAERGVSERTLRRHLAIDRQIADGMAEVDDESRGAEELPWVELATGPSQGHHYRLDHDQSSHLPDGPFRVGTHNGRRMQVKHRDDGIKQQTKKESKHKFRPKSRKKRAG